MTEYLKDKDLSSDVQIKDAVKVAYALATKYGEGAAALSCEMYDAVSELSGAVLPAAEPAATATYGETAKTVYGILKDTKKAQAVGNGIGRLVKMAGVDTTIKNGMRDKAQFAWIPHGDTCPFCLMLASNGWQDISKKALKKGHAEHIHNNCDCTYMVRFDDKTTVAGYDPDKYKAMYDDAEGDTWKEKVNFMRREKYDKNKDAINARRRELYKSQVEEKKQKEIDDLQKSDTIKIDKGLGDEKLRISQFPASSISKMVATGEYSLRLTQQEYDKHIEGTIAYENYRQSREKKGLSPQSVLTISKSEAQAIINRYSGTGIIKPRRDGSPTNIEKITCDSIIGYYYNKGIKVYTTKAAIHHGSKGSHLVPIKGNDYD